MLTFDIFYVLLWYFVSLAIGFAFLPLTFLLFQKLKDNGYIFSKIVGTSVLSYTVFLFGTTRILPFTRPAVILILILGLFINYFSILRRGKKASGIKQLFIKSFKNNYWIYILEEIIFFCAFGFWSLVKTFQPNINGLEKFMDFGFINSILRSDFFPARDIWLTPFTINYYYFGHLTTAVLTKLSAIPSNITFNLMQAFIFALCFTASFSIGLNLYNLFKTEVDKKINNAKLIISGLLTTLLVTLSGNFHIIYSFFKSYPGENPVPPWQLSFLPLSFPNSYWYPNATRFIYHTIHEFPIYSWVVSDLHGHVLDIPYVLLAIALLMTIVVDKKINILKMLFLSFLTAILYMTNAWDGAIYLALSAVFIFYNPLSNSSAKIHKITLFFIKKLFFKPVFYFVLLLFGYFIFTLPFNLFFKPFVSGVGLLCSPAFLTARDKIGPFLFESGHCQKSPVWQLLILYGFFYFWVFSFFVFLLNFIKRKFTKLTKADNFVIILIIFSTILIIVPEFFYVKDIYPAHYRANTMFKLAYQAFILLSICSGYIIVRIFTMVNLSRKHFFSIGYFLISLVLISLVLIYPYLAITSYYNFGEQQELNGTKYLASLYPNDYKAILWLNKNIKGQPVVLEAQGDSYTDYARVSANTGLPTVLGWTVHEWLWRGTYNVPAPRIEDIKLLYEAPNLLTTKKLIGKYNISYVFIGNLEREKYKKLNLEKFNKLGKIIYSSGSTKVYKIN
jgi:YYY domain-containing protein